MSDDRKFSWFNELIDGSAGAPQTQREGSPDSFTMEMDYDSLDEQEREANPPLDDLNYLPPAHAVAAAAHAMGFPTPAVIDEDSDDAMDIDEDDVSSPAPINPSSSNYEMSPSTIPSLEQFLAQTFEEKAPAFNLDPLSEASSSQSASSGENTPARIKQDSRSPASPPDYPLDEPTWFDVLDPNSNRALDAFYTSFAGDISRPSSPTDDDDNISVASFDNDYNPLNDWRTLLYQLGPYERDEERLIEFVKAPLGECPDDE